MPPGRCASARLVGTRGARCPRASRSVRACGLSVCFYDSIAALVEQFKASVKVFEIYCKIIKDNITKSISAAFKNVVMFFSAFVVLEVGGLRL